MIKFACLVRISTGALVTTLALASSFAPVSSEQPGVDEYNLDDGYELQLGDGTTECMGEGCASLQWWWDGQCVHVSNIGRSPVEVQYAKRIWLQGESRTKLVPAASTILPGPPVRLSADYCFEGYDKIGLFRASVRSDAGPGPPVTDRPSGQDLVPIDPRRAVRSLAP